MNGVGLSRRRFLTIAGAMLAAGPARAQKTTRWRGLALGAEAEITLRGSEAEAGRALHAAKQSLRRMEQLFSLYDPASDLVRLNESGWLREPAPDFLTLLRLSDRIHAATGSLFDPSIQPLWRLMAAHGGRPDAAAVDSALSRIGWSDVLFHPEAVRFARPGMALTFNGIAQGFATDRVAEVLAGFGFTQTLVNIGEFRAGEGGWNVGVADPDFGLVAARRLTRTSIATSSPAALRFGESGPGHIMHPARPGREPMWSTVSVEAKTAALADGISTALAFLDADEIGAVRRAVPGLRRILLIGRDGGKLEFA